MQNSRSTFLPKEAARVQTDNIEELHSRELDPLYIPWSRPIPLNAYGKQRKLDSAGKQREHVEREKGDA